MTALMVQGCTSWAGKSLLTTALCRWFADRGVAAAPFKAQNMSNNARVVAHPDGGTGEIGVAQWLQARAARVEPDVRMNPVLLKPEQGGSQVVRMGRVDHGLSRRRWEDRAPALWPTVTAAYDDLAAEHDLVVIEGAGSPAEINLAHNDIVNMAVAEHADAPVLLVADIDRGGAFAHLYGTWSLVPGRHRDRIRGFVLNRFRGDATLLPPGPEQLERLTGAPTVGLVPMLDHDLPDEDGAALHAPPPADAPTIAVVRYPAGSNLDELVPLEQVAHVRWVRSTDELARAAVGPDGFVVLPGSKDVASDLDWLRRVGLADAVTAAAKAGTRVLGICGGLQLLGNRLVDPDGVDGEGRGLALLPVETAYGRDKRVEHTTVELAGVEGPWGALDGRTLSAYEIRHGHTGAVGTVRQVAADARAFQSGPVLGIAFHGLLEDPDVLEALTGRRPGRDLERTLDRLATAVDEHLDAAFIQRLTGPT